MKHPANRLRELLRSKLYSAGATPQQLSNETGRLACDVKRTLHTMPDAYIADWVRPPSVGRPAQLWRVVVPPPHCPPPPKGRTK